MDFYNLKCYRGELEDTEREREMNESEREREKGERELDKLVGKREGGQACVCWAVKHSAVPLSERSVSSPAIS